MKKKYIIALLLITSFLSVKAQCIRLENGFSFSSLKSDRVPMFTDNIQRYAFLVGADYWEHSYWNLSSEIGYVTKGGKEKDLILDDNIANDYIESQNYLHLNTTFRVKYSISQTHFYVGIGPKVDILVKERRDNDFMLKEYEYRKLNWGLKPEIGLYQTLKDKIRVGLSASYLLNFRGMMHSPYIIKKDNTFLLTFSLGYMFKASSSRTHILPDKNHEVY